MNHKASNQKLSRRMVLKGIGGSVLALPLLESFLGDRAIAQVSDTSFAVFFRQANGCAQAQNTSEIGDEPERFFPTGPGALTAGMVNGRAVDELSTHLNKLLILANVNGEHFDYGDGHANGALQSLTARGPTEANKAGDSEASGESIDHRIGVELNPAGRDSLFMYSGSDYGWLGGPCISYRSSGTRRSPYRNPKNAYAAIAGMGGGADNQAQQQAADRQASINDLVRGQMSRLMSHPRLSKSDKERLDLHFTSIRDLEVNLNCELEASLQSELDGAGSFYDSDTHEDVIKTTQLHMDVTAMAIACGYTRSAAIQVGDGNDGQLRFRDPDTGDLMENYHYISHRRMSHDSEGTVIPNSDLLHHKIDRIFGQMFNHLLDRLDAYSMPDGKTLLDHGVAVWFNDNGNGPGHSVRNVPWILAGGANGFLKTGEYLQLGGGSNAKTHNRLLATIATAVGVRNGSGDYFDSFGDPSLPTGLLDEIIV